MTNAKRDQNSTPTMLGVSSVDGVTPIPIEVDPITGAIKAEVIGTTAGHIIQDEGVNLPDQPKLNFVGNGVAVTNDAGNDATVVTIDNPFSSVSASKLIGRGSAGGAGAAQEITIGAGLSLTGTTLTATGTATGDVVGPSSAVDSNLAAFDTTTGKLIKDSGKKASDLVPYTGATGNVDLGTHNLSLNKLHLATSPTVGTPATGDMYWNATDNTVDIVVDATNGVTLQVGHEQYIRVVNKTGVQINDGQVVYINGTQGNRPTVALALASALTSSSIIGVATQNIADNAEGNITTFGVIHGYNTSGFTAGDTLYVSAATPGLLTKTAPSTPNFVVMVGKALDSTNNGHVLVLVQPPLSTLSTLAGNSDLVAPTEKAVKTYADTKAPQGLLTASGLTQSTARMLGRTTAATGAVEEITVDGGLSLSSQSLSVANTGIVATKKYFHGVVSRTTNPLPTNLTTTTFTLSATAYPISYYYMGTLVNVTSDKTTTLSGAAGLYFIYFDAATGNLTNSTVFPGIDCTSNVLIASVLWNGSNYGLVNDERHGMYRDCEWHKWAHTTVGTRYRSGITLTHNSGTGAAATFSTTAGEIWDEDIQFTVPASSAFPTANAGRLLYQTGATTYAFSVPTSTVPGYLGANNRPNVVNSTGYVLTQVPSATNRYVNVFVYATTDVHTPIYFFTETVTNTIAGQGGYTSLANARAVPFPNLAGQIGISAELKPIYRLIWRADGVLQAIDTTQDDYRTVTSLPMSAGTTSTTASAVTFNPAGSISSTTVQTAIEELDTEKLALAGGTMTGQIVAAAGTASAGTAPIKLQSGTVNSTPEAGAIEYDGTDYFITI